MLDQNLANNPFLGPLGAVGYNSAPFSANMAFGIQSVTDGLSQTVWMSEVIIGENANDGANSDHRGDIYNDDHNCSMFMTYSTPNSSRPKKQ